MRETSLDFKDVFYFQEFRGSICLSVDFKHYSNECAQGLCQEQELQIDRRIAFTQV